MDNDRNNKFISSIQSNLPKILSKIDKIKSYQDVKNDFDVVPLHDSQIKCSLCGKMINASDIEVLNSYLISGIPINYCKDCWNSIKNNHYWVLVCMGCKDIKMVGEPIRNSKTGFQLEKDKIYHLEYCPSCHPEKFKHLDLKPGVALPVLSVEEQAYNNKYGYTNNIK